MNQHLPGSVHHVLSKLGIDFNSTNRGLRLNFQNTPLNQLLFLQHIQGRTGINSGQQVTLICLSTDAHIALKIFIGQAVTVEQITDRGQLHLISGIITQACTGHSDGGFATYKLILQDSFSSLLSRRRNSRVFMQKSVVDITQIFFTEWPQRNPIFAKSIQLDQSQLMQSYDVYPFIMQNQESDFDFLTRLWRAEGINWFIDTTQHYQHELKLFDDNRTLTQLPLSTISFHRSDATEQHDSITALNFVRQLTSSQVHLQRWEPQHGTMNEQLQLNTNRQTHDYSSTALNLEQSWHLGSASLGDLDGQDSSTLPNDGQLVRLGQLFIQQNAFESKSFSAQGTVRDVKAGYWFGLEGHARLDQHNSNARELLITEISFHAKNNLPKSINQHIIKLIEQSQWLASLNDFTNAPLHRSHMTLVQRDTAVVPFYDPALHGAKAYPMRARVVGAHGEQIHVDAWGRIKVQFLFSRAQDNTHSGGAGSSSTDSDSAWVDVLTPWAGNGETGYGARFLPRAGELVVIDFFDGNANRPFVAGRIHEGSRLPAQFDHSGTLPGTKALSGLKSQEINGSGFNQLRFDDTNGQISAQLASSHGTTQLNLGNLVHPRSSEDGEARGEGFELRTDMAGAIRSKGLYLSTFIKNTANGSQLDISDALEQTSTSLTSMKTLAEYAQKQHAEPADMLATLEAYIQKIENQ